MSWGARKHGAKRGTRGPESRFALDSQGFALSAWGRVRAANQDAGDSYAGPWGPVMFPGHE